MRNQIESFNSKFIELKARSLQLLDCTEERSLHGIRFEDGRTVGEYILRSAGAVEQMIGGITRRLWDDPFEWTLTERMQTAVLIREYIEEVEASRLSGFRFIKDDSELGKMLPAPIEMMPLERVLTEALIRAESYLDKAESLLSSQAD